jgi:hypothetical protein
MTRRYSRRTLFLVFTLLGLASRASAGTISLFSTGVDASGNPLPGGSSDPHWTITSGPSITSPTPAIVIADPPGTYAESPTSSWIWVNASGDGGINSPYTFALTFTLTATEVNTATISGLWGVDNDGSILLNGSAAAGTGALSLGGDGINFTQFSSFTITGGFVAGVNTLEFQAIDTGNPGALNVNGLVLTTSAVPEPSSLVMGVIGLGLAGGFVAMKRRRSSVRTWATT